MMGEVVTLNTQTKLDIPSDVLLQKAIDGGVTNAVIIGYDTDGELWFSSSDADARTVLWLLEKAKERLFQASAE